MVGLSAAKGVSITRMRSQSSREYFEGIGSSSPLRTFSRVSRVLGARKGDLARAGTHLLWGARHPSRLGARGSAHAGLLS
jgi:hypothetical protein